MPATPSRVKALISQLTNSSGRFAGKPFIVHPFQDDIIDLCFELGEDGRRLRREVVIGVARKNGKSELMAALGLALLCIDGERGGLVVIAAAKRDQARLILDVTKRMVNNSSLNGVPLSKYIQVRRDHLYFPELDGTLKVISADAQKEMGLNPQAVIVDEGHVTMETNRELYDALLTAQAARENPLMIVITTAGAVPAGPMYELYEYGVQVREGKRNDPRFGFLWFEGQSDLPVDDPRSYMGANPAAGLFLDVRFLQEAAQAVLNGKAPEGAFRRLHCNQWTTAAERWLPFAKVEACRGEPNIPEGADVWIAIDAAIRRDTMAVSCVWIEDAEHEMEDGSIVTRKVAHALVRRFIPSEAKGYIDPEEVEMYVLGMCAKYSPTRISYDPAYMQMLAQSLADRGLPIEPFPQSAMRMERATETFQRLVLDGRLRFGHDSELLKQIASVTVKTTERGVRISKAKTVMPIDMAVALAMALDDALGEEDVSTAEVFFVA